MTNKKYDEHFKKEIVKLHIEGKSCYGFKH